MNQTLEKEKFEVIIVLNGPKEPFHSEITGLISSYPTIRLLYEEKSGVSNARNKGIEDSKGNFICFIDDDDMISPTYLESLLEISSREIVKNLSWNEKKISLYANYCVVSKNMIMLLFLNVELFYLFHGQR